MKTVERILKAAAAYPERTAAVSDTREWSYRELEARIRKRAEELGREAESFHLFRVTQSIDFLPEYLGAHLAGKVAVPVEHDLPEEDFKTIRSRCEATVFPASACDVLFTTGTTAHRKGSILSHTAVWANAENLIEGLGFKEGMGMAVCGPLSHIASLSKVNPTLMLGGTIIITCGMKDINAFLTTLEYPVDKIATFLVPANIRILLQFGKERLGALKKKIEFIETGSAPLSSADMKTLCTLLPESRIYNTYASTETGVVTSFDYSRAPGERSCVGKPLKNTTVEIVDGRIICRGKTLMTCYLGNEELTRSVMRHGAVYTNDLGYFDSSGRLFLQGRIDNILNIGGYKILPSEIEDMVLQMSCIKECICIEVPHILQGNALKLLYVKREGAEVTPRSIADFLKGKLERYKLPALYEETDHVARTFNGKLDRRFYKHP